MIALHLGYCNSEILLWSEAKQIGSHKDTKKALKKLGLSSFAGLKSKNYYAWLPGKQGKTVKPFPSHPLMGDMPTGKYKTGFHPYPIEAARLDFERLEDILLAAASKAELGTDVMFGNSVIWMANLFALGVDIVIKELFIPFVEKRDNNFFSVWKPVAGHSEERLLTGLGNDLPAVFRSLSTDEERQPQVPGIYIVTELLENVVDTIVRRGSSASVFSKKSVHDAWLSSLVSKDNKLKWSDEQELIDLERQLADWARQIVLAAKSKVQVCFRLLEPIMEQDTWKLEFLLQSKEDPGLIAPLSFIWSKKKKDIAALKKLGLDSIEVPLMLLGQAAGIYPPLKESLNMENTGFLELDASQAVNFLFEYADILSRMGFSVMLPTWWTGRNTERKLSLRLEAKSPQMKSSAGMSLETILRFDYQASLGDEKMTVKELQELAELKSSLVRIRGEWTYIDTEKLRQCLDFLNKQKEKEINVSELIQTFLGNRATPVEVEEIKVSGWVGKLLDGLSDKKGFKQLAQPSSFAGELRHYQKRGYSWLHFLKKWGFGACLADDMGLGKTIQTLALILNDALSGETKPVLLICPTTVLNNWVKETERFTPQLQTVIHHGPERFKGKGFAKHIEEKAIVITSFGLLIRDVQVLKEVNWAGIVVDEAQNIKNSQTKASKAVRSLNADYRVALTGTPVENHVGDLWSIMEYLNPGMLGSLQDFKDRFHKPITLYRDENAAVNLKRIVSPFILRRLKTDKKIIKDLPDKIETKEYCNLTKEQVSLYKAVADEVQQQVEGADGIARKGAVLAALTRLKQVCNHPAQYFGDNSELFGRSGKLKRTLELLSEIYDNGERTLIFTQYYEMGHILQQVIQQHFSREALFLHGKITKKKRDNMIERFQGDDNTPFFFILSLKAGGTGITLTKANNVIHYDRWWNPAVEQQATDRAFRIGQKQNVQVHKLIVAGTLEEKIDGLIMKKQEIAEKVVSTGESWLSELSNSDFKSLISLSKTVIGEE